MVAVRAVPRARRCPVKHTSVIRRYAHFDDGTGWPLPDNAPDEHEECLEWVLRYGTPTRSQLYRAASYIAAYGALIHQTSRRRQEIAEAVKRALAAQGDTK